MYEGEFNGIKYNSYLANSDGVNIVLYKRDHHNHKDIMKAKSMAKSERDVVGFIIEKEVINEM